MRNRHDRVEPSLLIALDVLLTERHVTRAAARLGVTQSAMSHKLRALRDQLGDPLLVAGRRGLVLTERAQAIAGPLRLAMQDLSAATAQGAGFEPAVATRTFRVSTSDYGQMIAIPQVVAVMEREAPHVELQLEGPTPDVGERLADGRLDAAVGPSLPMPAGLLRTRVAREGFAVVVRSGHPVLRRRWSLARYLEQRHLLIAPRGAAGSAVDDALAAQGLGRRVAIRVSSFAAAPFVVATSDLCLTAPSALIDATAARLGLVVRALPIAIPPVDAFLYWHARVDKDPAHRWLRRLIHDATRVLDR